MPFRRTLSPALLSLALFLSGCAAAAPLALLPVAVPALIAGAGGGISYTITNIAYKTTTHPIEDVEDATYQAIDKMSIRIAGRRNAAGYIKIRGETDLLSIYIKLEKVTETMTRIEVNATSWWVFKDKTTAYEVIFQTERLLEGLDAGALQSAPKRGVL